MKRKGLGEGETSSSPLQCSLCLRAISSLENIAWYLHNISISDEKISTIQPCYKEKLKRMSKEAKKRDKDAMKRLDKWEEREFNDEILEEEKDGETILPVVSPIRNTPDIPIDSFWTSLGSTIYCLGSHLGGCDFSNEVRCFGLSDPHSSWEWGPPMINRRLLGKAVTLDDKLYVFGGTEDYTTGPWAEVLEKYGTVWKWRALKKPPFRQRILHVFASSYTDGGKKILVGSHSKMGLYAYCPTSDSWEVVDKKFCLTTPCFTDPVVVEKTMYWVGDETICAYNLDTKVPLSGRMHFWGVKNALEYAKFQLMVFPFFHLSGDMFLLMWYDTDFGRKCPRSEFVIHKFRILKRADPMEGEYPLTVEAVNIEYVLTNHHFSSFDGMLLLEPK